MSVYILERGDFQVVNGVIYILKRENRRKNTPVEQLFTEGGKVLLQLKAVHVEWDVISHITVKPAVRICSIVLYNNQKQFNHDVFRRCKKVEWADRDEEHYLPTT